MVTSKICVALVRNQRLKVRPLELLLATRIVFSFKFFTRVMKTPWGESRSFFHALYLFIPACFPIGEYSKREILSSHSPNVSTTPITAMECRQCLPLSDVQLKGKHCRKPHCRKPHCRNGVIDTFGHTAPELIKSRVRAAIKYQNDYDLFLS